MPVRFSVRFSSDSEKETVLHCQSVKVFGQDFACPAVIIVLMLLTLPRNVAGEAVVDEHFQDLSHWTPVVFPKIDEHSQYQVEEAESGHILVATSHASASGIRYLKEFNVMDYPLLSWRWKVGNIYTKGDLTTKSGDDVPLRVYLMFKFDPEKAALGDRIMYGLAKIFYGEYPPHSSLGYVWSNRKHEENILVSPYTDRLKLIIVQSGNSGVGLWKSEQVNIVKDYKKAFGTLPPESASIAIMNDSDNTGESSVSYLEYIRVFNNE